MKISMGVGRYNVWFLGEDFVLNLEFMQRAYFIGVLIAIISPTIGVIIVLRRLSMIGDSLPIPPWQGWH